MPLKMKRFFNFAEVREATLACLIRARAAAIKRSNGVNEAFSYEQSSAERSGFHRRRVLVCS